jgi:Zn-dependent protease
LLAISFHESAHAYVAYRLGDPTARDLGRVTLNPIPHIDIIGLIAILVSSFGWAKPVPVNPYNLKNPIKDNLWISLAGPVSNLILAIISGIVFRFALAPLASSEGGYYILTLIQSSVILNIILMVFNLIPIPPLDGFHVLEALVSTDMYIQLQRIQQFGPFLLLALVFFGGGIISAIISPFIRILGGFLLGSPMG